MKNKIIAVYHEEKGWTLVDKGESSEQDLYIIDKTTAEPLYWDTQIEAERFLEENVQA